MHEFILAVLQLLDTLDRYSDPVYWATHGPYAPITFYVNCNDFFWWAAADAECLTAEDLPALEQAIAEARAIDGSDDGITWGFLLWCARKRGMRPLRPAYPHDQRLRALFDACGPEREA